MAKFLANFLHGNLGGLLKWICRKAVFASVHLEHSPAFMTFRIPLGWGCLLVWLRKVSYLCHRKTALHANKKVTKSLTLKNNKTYVCKD